MSNCDAAVRIVRIDRKFKVLLREGLRVGAVECQQRVHECERRYMITEEMAVYRKGCVQKAKEDAAFIAMAPAISYAPGV